MSSPGNGKYDDILYYPHHQSATRPHMTLINRAAQFSPFAALTGYGDAVEETARLTDRRRELGEAEVDLMNRKVAFLQEYLTGLEKDAERPVVEICYFIPDERKEGGSYKTVQVRVKRVDGIERAFFLTDGQRILLDDVCDLRCSLFAGIEEGFG